LTETLCTAVEIAGGLVSQQDGRTVYQRTCDGHPLLLSPGHVQREMLCVHKGQNNANSVMDIVGRGGMGNYIASVTGRLCATAQGEPLQQRNVLRVLHSVKRVGFHAFRRFRLTWLRKNGAPKALERFSMGHAPEEVGDLYSKLNDDVAFRQEWADGLRSWYT
jgi:hypothetical protein